MSPQNLENISRFEGWGLTLVAYKKDVGPYPMSITCKTERVHKSILDILQNNATLPQTAVSSPGHVAFLILNFGKHGEHGDHVCCHSISQRQHGFWRNLPQRTSIENNRLISLVYNLETEIFLSIKMLPNLLSWFHHIVKSVKTLWFTATYYIETTHHHRCFLNRKIIGIYKQ